MDSNCKQTVQETNKLFPIQQDVVESQMQRNVVVIMKIL
jgi:hypothetical protein